MARRRTSKASRKLRAELHKFKVGSLHSGSKRGPLVRSRKQAVAIALSVSGQSRRRRGK